MFLSKLNMSKIEESISKLKRFKYHAIGRLELEDAIDNVVSWYEQMPMPNSTELIAMWGEEEAMLKEKDFRGDEWRLAQNAFMDGFAKGATIDMPMPEDTVLFQKGVAEGKRLMMEDAVEGIVHHCVSAHYVVTNEEQLSESLKRFKDSDKVKVIIVKEDE